MKQPLVGTDKKDEVGGSCESEVPAETPEDIGDLFSQVPGMEEKLIRRSISVAAIARKAVENNFEPGELFRLEEKNKTVRVWLE